MDLRRIPPGAARARLDRMQMGDADRAAVETLLGVLGDDHETPVERALEALFGERTPGAATKALERLVKVVNAVAEAEEVDLTLEVRGGRKLGARGRTVGFSAHHLEPARDPLRERGAVGDALILDRHATVLGPRRIVLCHAPDDADPASRLWDRLIEAVGAEGPRLSWWRADRDVVAGDEPESRLRQALSKGELAVVALSNSWRAAPGLDAIVRDHRRTAGLHVVPVALRPERARTGLPEDDPVTFYCPEGRTFMDLRGPAAVDRWVNGLAAQIERLLARPEGRASESVPHPLPEIVLADRRALRDDKDDRYYKLFSQLGNMDPDVRSVSADGRPVDDVVAFLTRWAHEPDSAPLAALLGEYGTGKTITCQELTERLREDPTGPETLYFDLRRLGGLDHGVPALADILTACIKGGWVPGDLPLPTGEQIIARAARTPTLFVVDGLDEVLVRLDTAQGVAFTHELLKLRPIRTRDGVRAPFAGAHTKVLISCRTHYFRSLREQSRHFLEHDRDLATAEDYHAVMLLPLADDQIRDYLAKTLPDRDAAAVMDMLRAVHDLSDLATRPYTLTKVAAQVPFIEQRLAHGRPVHAATIYRQVLRDWLARDRGKHRLRPDHKLTLMARLAAWAWKRGDRRLDAAELDDWLDEQLAEDPVLRRRYRTWSRDQLEEDLRTATFVTRGDHHGPDRPDFRFAHSSIHEYFLAQYLCDALREDRREDWCLPVPSAETLDFLGQLILDDDEPDALLTRLGRWRAPYVAEASELWLRYLLHAREHGLPHPLPAASDLSGAALRGWHFTGTEGDPLAFTGATLTGADLRDTRWDHVNLTGAILDRARLERAVLHDVTLTRASVRGADLSGAFLRRCRLDDTDLADAHTHRLRHHDCGTALPEPATPHHTRLHPLTGHGGLVWGVAFGPDGSRVASAGGDGSVRVWDVVTGECVVTLSG
ncbi:NACHT domain-containing protein, partial [Saccharothrix violaceirubra]